jgi:hypothetical protein
MLPPLAAVRPSQPYCPQYVAAHREPENMQAVADQPVSNQARLTVIDPPILDHERGVEIDISGGPKGEPVLPPIDSVFGWIELDLHDLM